jgi:hypothetical protein
VIPNMTRNGADEAVADKEKTIDLLRPVLYATSANSDVEETFVRNRRALIDGTGVGKQAFQHVTPETQLTSVDMASRRASLQVLD